MWSFLETLLNWKRLFYICIKMLKPLSSPLSDCSSQNTVGALWLPIKIHARSDMTFLPSSALIVYEYSFFAHILSFSPLPRFFFYFANFVKILSHWLQSRRMLLFLMPSFLDKLWNWLFVGGLGGIRTLFPLLLKQLVGCDWCFTWCNFRARRLDQNLAYSLLFFRRVIANVLEFKHYKRLNHLRKNLYIFTFSPIIFFLDNFCFFLFLKLLRLC